MKIETEGYPEILTRAKAIGAVIFEGQDYDMNIIGERNPEGTSNIFDDWIHVLFLKEGEWQWYVFKCTTDAGLYWLNSHDTAILIHNRQYRGVYKFGLHRGQYRALVQRGGPVSIWRDRNRDNIHDYGGEEHSGYFGINIHRASANRDSEVVDRYSAGCQVLQSPADFEAFLSLLDLQIEHLSSDSFSYTLLLGK